jgi:hypothetical protein
MIVMQIIKDQDNKSIVTPAEEQELWTTARFKDEFFLCLTKVIDPNRSNSIINDRCVFLADLKYYQQARKLRPWISISKPAELIPPFIINISDLTPRIRKELKEFVEFNNAKELNFLLKEIATKFFENIDYEYAHDSILSHLIVRLEN